MQKGGNFHIQGAKRPMNTSSSSIDTFPNLFSRCGLAWNVGIIPDSVMIATCGKDLQPSANKILDSLCRSRNN